jgi:hypothetical protein
VRKAVVTALTVSALILAGCGQQQAPGSGSAAAPGGTHGSSQAAAVQAHPQVVEPVAGKASPATGDPVQPSIVSVGASSGSGALAQPVSEAEIRQELQASGVSANPNQAALTPDRLAIAPVDAPYVVQQVIQAGNEIAHLPYRFGGGHGTFVDNAYDCSGSLSFVFAAAGLLNTTMTSGQLMHWGKPGPGKWITVFASPGHTFMYVAGLRFDTVALAETGSRWSNRSADEPDLGSFAVRHPVGL